MKKYFCVLLATVLLFLTGCMKAPERNNKIIATSFYPVYIFTLNIVDGAEGLEVKCMAEQSTGCLHDYTLTARDARLLNDASAFVINGAGMEAFVEDLYETVEQLPVVDSSTGIDILCGDGEAAHTHDEDDLHGHNHAHSENSHIWMSVANAKKQVVNITNGLTHIFPEYKELFEKNKDEYLKRLSSLDKEVISAKAELQGQKVMTFHTAYDYLAKDLGIEIVRCVESDHGGEPSARELAELCDEINKEGINALITEPQYSGSAMGILAEETNASVYILNPVISGNEQKSAYEDIMLENLQIIKKAVK